jgi:hypothetical protein
MLKSRANLVEELIAHDQRTGFAYGEKPRFEVRQEPLLHHFSSSFLSEQTRTDRRALVRLSSLSRSKTFQFPSQVRERTGPALIHNQLVDRSLQTNVCHETSCYEFQIVIATSSWSASGDRFALEFGILAGEICNRTPLLNGIVGHPQLERLNPGFAFARKLTAQLERIPVCSRLR